MLGTIYKQRGRADEALAEFRETIRLNPSSADAYTSMAQVLDARNDKTGAAAAFAEADRLNKRKAESQASVFAVNAGRELMKRGQLQPAIAKFRDAVRLAPDNPQAHYQLALALRSAGATADARAEFAEAIRLAPYLRVPDR
jgi:Flp pilus assembly protein TadD